MSDLYRQEILDRARNPRHRGLLASFDLRADEVNVTCGDEVTIDLKIKNQKSKIKITDKNSKSPNPLNQLVNHSTIESAGFEGSGCIISQASCDMLLDLLPGKTVFDVMAMRDEDVLAFFGGQLTLSRQTCALLPLLALRKGISEMKKKT